MSSKQTLADEYVKLQYELCFLDFKSLNSDINGSEGVENFRFFQVFKTFSVFFRLFKAFWGFSEFFRL